MRALVITACLLASAPSAQTLPGADDPAFRAPFERALQADDPTALAEIHAAAEAGNLAALRALPAVLVWADKSKPVGGISSLSTRPPRRRRGGH